MDEQATISEAMRLLAKRRAKKKRAYTCEVCGMKMLRSQPAKTCSPACKQRARRKRQGRA